jgi:DNA-binding MarR family transcriptional regulator
VGTARSGPSCRHLAERRADPADGRRKQVRLTDEGTRLTDDIAGAAAAPAQPDGFASVDPAQKLEHSRREQRRGIGIV